MSKAKRFSMAILMMLVLLVLTSCGGPEHTYKQAQELLSKGEYSAAAEKFESLGSYEEATTLTMYCKACALCESGNFEAGIAGFESLGNYKDCSLRISYYTARSWDDNSVGTTEFEWMNRAKSVYNENPLYLDSAKRITALDTRIETAKKTIYDNAVAAAEQGQYSTAIATFQRLGNYKDSAKRATYYGIRMDEEVLAGTTDETAYDAVAARYTNMGDYIDCADRATTVMTQATAIRDDKYDAAVALMNEGKYSEAITAFTAIKSHKDSATKIQACETGILDNEYDAAVKLMEDGKYIKAYEAFIALNGYKDSNTKASSIYEKAQNEKRAKAPVGSYITFGSYPKTSKGNAEPIEWLVLAKKNDRLLVISRVALDCKPYNNSSDGATWENCSLRKWLNNDFLNKAFNSTEQELILTVTVPADNNPSYNTPSGNATQDKIFLLSLAEAEKYFTGVNIRNDSCGASVLARQNGAELTSWGECSWWLRTPGKNLNRAVYIEILTEESGALVNNGKIAVRPALWIKLD